MKRIQWEPLIVSLLISLGAGALASILTADSMKQYMQMYKPPLSPPGVIFPIVWTILFTLMGIASYLIYLSPSEDKKPALTVYLIQLVVNVLWSVIFFRFDAYLLAFAWLVFLWYLIFITIKQFYPINKTAAILMLPYLAWVTFAGYLNLAIAIHYV
ncbi:MAG TPA: TspO/MBR family protein [Lachnospiraceae bacterium]|nr:TspO/MBR family protein [Lachnospiraceae bacterium]